MKNNRNFVLRASCFVLCLFIFHFSFFSESFGFTFSLTTSKPVYFRYELVGMRVGLSGILEREMEITGKVTYEGEVVEDVGGESRVVFQYDPERKDYRGVWSPPWNPRKGTYLAEVSVRIPDFPKPLINRTAFEIRGRKGSDIPNGFSVMTIETQLDLTRLPIIDPLKGLLPAPSQENQEKETDWRYFTRWADFLTS